MRGHESHVEADGTEHDPDQCPPECTLNASLARLLDGLDDGSIVMISDNVMPPVDLIDDKCARPGCTKSAALMHKNVGYCVWDYRALPDTILSHVTTP